MPTKTLIQTLQLSTGTWTIEVSQKPSSAETRRLIAPWTDERTLITPVDPWINKAETIIMKGV